MAAKKDEEQKKFDDEYVTRLEAIRLHFGMKNGDMASLLGIAQNTYSTNLKHGYAPPPHRLRKLIEKGLTSDFILFGITDHMDRVLVENINSNMEDARERLEKLRRDQQ
nr:hypothetical protein [uncultured Azospirillum sp.]